MLSRELWADIRRYDAVLDAISEDRAMLAGAFELALYKWAALSPDRRRELSKSQGCTACSFNFGALVEDVALFTTSCSWDCDSRDFHIAVAELESQLERPTLTPLPEEGAVPAPPAAPAAVALCPNCASDRWTVDATGLHYQCRACDFLWAKE